MIVSSNCYGTDFATTASAFFFFYFGVELQHSAVAGSQLSLLCRRWQPTTLYSAVNSLYSLKTGVKYVLPEI